MADHRIYLKPSFDRLELYIYWTIRIAVFKLRNEKVSCISNGLFTGRQHVQHIPLFLIGPFHTKILQHGCEDDPSLHQTKLWRVTQQHRSQMLLDKPLGCVCVCANIVRYRPVSDWSEHPSFFILFLWILAGLDWKALLIYYDTSKRACVNTDHDQVLACETLF